MDAVSIFKWMGYILTAVTLIGGFALFYGETQEWIGSLTAAILSAILVLISFMILSWLLKAFLK